MEDKTKQIQNHLKILSSFLYYYQWLTDSYMMDFFTCNLYKKVPTAWASYLSEGDMEDLGTLLDLNGKDLRVRPLSMLAIRKLMTHTCLRRKMERCRKGKEDDNLIKEILSKKLFTKHVKPKKLYEVHAIAQETVRMASHHGIQWVLDVGSGLGHLSRLLAYGYDMRMIGLETQAELVCKARKFDQELERTVRRSKDLAFSDKDYAQFRPYHVQFDVNFSTSSQELMKIIKDNAGEEEKFGIVGLHPCGNLASILLRLFSECPNARFISIVGCCYHKMTISPALSQVGYPLSKFMRTGGFPKFTTNTTSIGCHAIEAYVERLRIGNYHHLRVHCFRATIERIITKRWPQHARSGLNNVSHGSQLQFSEYCIKALKKLELTVPPEDLQDPQTLEDLSRWKETVYYHSLWLMLGPAVESAILLDRALFLQEKGIQCTIFPAFDPLISPRNHVLSASKPH